MSANQTGTPCVTDCVMAELEKLWTLLSEERPQSEDRKWPTKEDRRAHHLPVEPEAVGCRLGPPLPVGHVRANPQAPRICGLPGQAPRCHHHLHCLISVGKKN